MANQVEIKPTTSGSYELWVNGSRVSTGTLSSIQSAAQNYGWTGTATPAPTPDPFSTSAPSIAYGATNTNPQPAYDPAKDWVAQEQEKQRLAELARIEQARKDAIIAQANQLKSSGAGTTAVNNFYASLSPADKPLVSSIFGNTLIAGYQPSNSNVQQTTVTGNGITSSATPTATSQDQVLQDILKNPNLSADQKSLLQQFFTTISTNDTSNADKLIAGFNAATQYSDPYFKAQALIATDALSRALGANTGDLAFQEEKLRNTLADLTATTASSKDQLGFQHSQELLQLQRSYEKDLENTQTNLAALGKTSSSVRTKAEGLLNEQNQGLVASSNRQFNYQTGNLDRTLANTTRDTTQSLAYLTDKATQDRIAALRTAEGQVGTTALQNLGYSNLLGTGGTPIGGSIPRQQVTDALSFSNSFVF